MDYNISKKNWDTIIGYAQTAYDIHKAEIGGMSVMVEGEDSWTLHDPVILKQEVSAGNCVLDKEALAIYYATAGEKWKKYNFRFCWWHSHHTMKAFWSGTDLTAIEEFSEGDISFALVVNLKEEYEFRVSVWKPLEVHQDVELNIGERLVNQAMIDEVKTLTTKPYVGWKWGKTGGTYRHNEMTLWNQSYGLMEDEKGPLDEVMDLVNELCCDFITEVINYTDWKREAASINKEFKKYGIKIKNNISKVKLIEVSHALHGPEGLIEVDEKKYKDTKDKEDKNGTNNAISGDYLPF